MPQRFCLVRSLSPVMLLVLLLSFLAPLGWSARAETLSQDFSTDPHAAGWKIFGNTNLFHWDAGAHHLDVTWDSTQPNSYFYHPLGTSLSRSEDFRIEFDLNLTDATSGNEPGKTGGLELAIGLWNLDAATSTNFMRGAFGGTPDLMEFDYFPAGYYDFGGSIFDVAATTTPTFISTNSFHYAPTVFAPYELELPTNLVIHVSMNYTASNQTLVTLLSTNNALFAHLQDVVLSDTNTSAFNNSDDVRLDTFSISSYSSSGDDFDSVLAHGYVDNVQVQFTLPVALISGAFSNTGWQVQFISSTNWVYTLQRTTNFATWADVSTGTRGSGGTLILQDSFPLPGQSYYRVSTFRP